MDVTGYWLYITSSEVGLVYLQGYDRRENSMTIRDLKTLILYIGQKNKVIG